jgi:signal transduction histidine kinase
LSISSAIASAYGGKLTFSSQKDIGTEVTLELPLINTKKMSEKNKKHTDL